MALRRTERSLWSFGDHDPGRSSARGADRGASRRRGPNKAAVALAHSLIELVWQLLSTGEVFKDLGEDYFTARQDPERRARRLVAQLEELGFTVTLETVPAVPAA